MTLCPGDSAVATVAYYNSGSFGWVAGRSGETAFLGTWDPEPGQDQPSLVGGDGTFGTPSTGWPRYNRVAVQPSSYVGPGQVAWFQFRVQAPTVPGTYRVALRPLIEGTTWMEDYGVFWVVTVPLATVSPSPTPTPAPTRTFAPAVPATGLVIWGIVTDASTNQPIDGACVTLGPPIRCWTTTDPNGKYVINLSDVAAQSGGQWDLYFLKNVEGQTKYAQKYSGLFTVSGIVQKDTALTRQSTPTVPPITLAPIPTVAVVRTPTPTPRPAATPAPILVPALVVPSTGYRNVGLRVSIRTKIDRGRFFELADRSLWEILSFDKYNTVLWSFLDEVVVTEDRLGLSPFNYKITNIDDRTTVSARYLRVDRHLIQDRLADGEFVLLEDGTLWQIDSFDSFDAILWGFLNDVVVIDDRQSFGIYPDRMINLTDRSSAGVRQIR